MVQEKKVFIFCFAEFELNERVISRMDLCLDFEE